MVLERRTSFRTKIAIHVQPDQPLFVATHNEFVEFFGSDDFAALDTGACGHNHQILVNVKAIVSPVLGPQDLPVASNSVKAHIHDDGVFQQPRAADLAILETPMINLKTFALRKLVHRGRFIADHDLLEVSFPPRGIQTGSKSAGHEGQAELKIELTTLARPLTNDNASTHA